LKHTKSGAPGRIRTCDP